VEGKESSRHGDGVKCGKRTMKRSRHRGRGRGGWDPKNKDHKLAGRVAHVRYFQQSECEKKSTGGKAKVSEGEGKARSRKNTRGRSKQPAGPGRLFSTLPVRVEKEIEGK